MVDLSSLARVLWHHKVIVLGGVVVACVAAVFSVYRVSDGALVDRVPPRYESSIRLLVSDVPVYQTQDVRQFENGQQIVRGLAVSQLAGTYPYVIMSDAVLGRVAQSVGAPVDAYDVHAYRRTVAPNADQTATLAGDNSLPIVEVGVTAASRDLAERVTTITAETFIALLAEQQNAARLPLDERVTVTQLGEASRAEPVGSSQLGLQVLVFIGVLMMFVFAALSRHNLQSTRDGGFFEQGTLSTSSNERLGNRAGGSDAGDGSLDPDLRSGTGRLETDIGIDIRGSGDVEGAGERADPRFRDGFVHSRGGGRSRN